MLGKGLFGNIEILRDLIVCNLLEKLKGSMKYINNISFVTKKNITKALQAKGVSYIVLNVLGSKSNILIAEDKSEIECDIEDLTFMHTACDKDKYKNTIKELNKRINSLEKKVAKLQKQDKLF